MNPKEKPPKRQNPSQSRSPQVAAIDLFCGAGGLTRGLLNAGIPVVAGYDIDPACKHPYEFNNAGAVFQLESVTELTSLKLSSIFPKNHIRVLVGCAPCQPFSRYTQGIDGKDKLVQWGLLLEFGRIVQELRPEIVSMENVPEIQRHHIFEEFKDTLKKSGYHICHQEVFCPEFNIPQQRKRLVLLASLLGPISLWKPPAKLGHITVHEAIGHLPALEAGGDFAQDPLHRACRLSSLNLKRIRASKPGGTWRDWPLRLRAKCHRQESGQTYPSVYGRMQWDRPSPTITTQFFGFGNGRFGHPEQDRAITLREGAILQSFPEDYEFSPKGKVVQFATLGRLIGNAVPVRLGEAIGHSIKQHLGLLPDGVVNE
jgi:DNA (cytosine-5)-methyltransferase 1